MSKELKPCLLCHEPVSIIVPQWDYSYGKQVCVIGIACSDCGLKLTSEIETLRHHDKEIGILITKWNTRAETQTQKKLDAAVKALEEVSKIETTRLGRLAELFDLGDTSQEVKDNTERLRAGDSAISRLITKTLKEIE